MHFCSKQHSFIFELWILFISAHHLNGEHLSSPTSNLYPSDKCLMRYVIRRAASLSVYMMAQHSSPWLLWLLHTDTTLSLLVFPSWKKDISVPIMLVNLSHGSKKDKQESYNFGLRLYCHGKGTIHKVTQLKEVYIYSIKWHITLFFLIVWQ